MNPRRFSSLSDRFAVCLPHEGGDLTLRPIATAPRDGTHIIGMYFNPTGGVVKCWFQSEFGAFISSCHQQTMHNGYTFEDGTTSRLHSPQVETPSHWLPYYSPGAEEAKQE